MTTTDINALRFPPAVDTGLGRFAVERDYPSYVDQLVRQVLLTNPGERINRPDFGCGLRRMVFAPLSDVTANLTQVTVLQALNKWLSDVIRVDDVKAEANVETLEVHVTYTLIATNERRYLNVATAI
jgi:phage baseplate assembly protein W